jgi:hypothetical protein
VVAAVTLEILKVRTPTKKKNGSLTTLARDRNGSTANGKKVELT